MPTVTVVGGVAVPALASGLVAAVPLTRDVLDGVSQAVTVSLLRDGSSLVVRVLPGKRSPLPSPFTAADITPETFARFRRSGGVVWRTGQYREARPLGAVRTVAGAVDVACVAEGGVR